MCMYSLSVCVFLLHAFFVTNSRKQLNSFDIFCNTRFLKCYKWHFWAYFGVFLGFFVTKLSEFVTLEWLTSGVLVVYWLFFIMLGACICRTIRATIALIGWVGYDGYRE